MSVETLQVIQFPGHPSVQVQVRTSLKEQNVNLYLKIELFRELIILNKHFIFTLITMVVYSTLY